MSVIISIQAGKRKGGRIMKKQRISRLLEPGMRAYFIIFLLFFLAVIWIDYYVAAAGIALLAAQYMVFRRVAAKRRREILGYIDSMTASIGDAAIGSVSNSPFPTVVIRVETGEILWSNERFQFITGERRHTFEIKLKDIIPDVDVRWLLEGRSEALNELRIKDRFYTLYGSTSKVEGKPGVYGTIYFIDTTELRQIRLLYEDTKPAVAIVLIDNYDEILKNGTVNETSKLVADVDGKIAEWAEQSGFLFRKYDRDRYLLLFERKHLKKLISDKFPILETVKALSSEPIPLTLSIGIGIDGESFAECLKFALLALDMALSRGGDQAVIKNKLNFEFYGGQTQEIQKRTKVKSRVMANALAQLIKDSGIVLVMGHKLSDHDSIGSAAGIICAARKLGKRAFLVVDRHNTAAPQLLQRLGELPEYEGVIISPTDAMLMADNRTLLVVTDVNRPKMVESEELLLSCNRVVVIDHHRRAASFIDNAALNFHEPYASSASELVSELLSYMVEGSPILKTEAEAMLAGIVLDTKNFSMRTGVRTFEAAARLRMAGADTVEIKRLFQTDFDSCIDRFEIVRRAHIHSKGVAVSHIEKPVARTVAAQAADELLNVLGVQASFVVFPEGEQTIVSARSLGQINVQVILEKLGGGGHLNMAGAQIKGQSPEIVLSMLYTAIDEYIAKVDK